MLAVGRSHNPQTGFWIALKEPAHRSAERQGHHLGNALFRLQQYSRLGDRTRLNKCLDPAISLFGWVDLKPAFVVYARAQGNLTCFPEASDVYWATGRPAAAQRILPTRPTRRRSDFCKLFSIPVTIMLLQK